MALENDNDALTPGYQLHWYEILDIIGRGGFGITYLARDNNLDLLVAIKEYLPDDFARRKDDSTVQPRTEIQSDLYEWGRERFVTEARILAKFTHPNIVRVISVFEQNNTAYMVMEYAQGEDLSSIYKKRAQDHQPLDEKGYLDIFIPICDGLELVHKEGFIHRDIKPANIYLCNDAQPVLLDFGSARQSVEHKTKTLTSLVTIGYAPFEQYQEGTGKQGPWTDIYSLGASIYVGITGNKPADAMERGGSILETGKDTYKPLSRIARDQFSEHFLLAVDNALLFKVESRPHHILRWADMLLGRIEVPTLDKDLYVDVDRSELEKTVIMPSDRHSSRNSKSRSEKPTRTAPSRGSQGFVDSLGQRIRDISEDIEQPLESVMEKFREGIRRGVATARRSISSLPANTVFASVIIIILILSLAVILFSLPENRQASDTQLVNQAATEDSQQADATIRLMKLARKAYKQQRFTLPRGQSAYDYLQDIFAINAKHGPAKTLLNEMQQQLLERSHSYLASGNQDRALGLVEQLLTIDPSNTQAISLKNMIVSGRDGADDIHTLLTKADLKLRQKYFVRPESDSAYYYYSRVLALDPANEAATRGLRRLSASMFADAQAEYRAGHLAKARQYLDDMKLSGLHLAEAKDLLTKVNKKLEINQNITDLLSIAKRHLDNNRYTSPQGNNAYDTYRQVLKLDKSSSDARAGIENIKKYYKSQFYRHLESNDFNRAHYNLQRIQHIAPGSALAKSMKNSLLQQQKTLSKKPEIEQVSELIGQFKLSIENRDLSKNRLLSQYRPGREAFIKQLFNQYKTINVKISGFQFISREHRATAHVELYNLVDTANNIVTPGNWSKFDIIVRRNRRGGFRIEW